jgi:nucleolar protein 9
LTLTKTVSNFPSFMYLAQHRFSSHCCETLFAKTAPIVTKEMATKFEGSAEEPTMEDLFLKAASEMSVHFAFLMSNTFATHPLRILILVLGGKPIDLAAGKSGLHSRKKEKVTVMGGDRTLDPTLKEDRVVPSSFRKAVERFIEQAVSGQDATNNLQSLATHPTCNPTLQLLVRLEVGQYGKQFSMILKALIPDEPLTADSPSASFVTNLLFDSVGSRLLETILEVGPAKTFKSIYKNFVSDRIATLAKSDTASYVLCTALNRLGKDDIEHSIKAISPEIHLLVERNKLNVIKVLYERAVARKVSTTALEHAIESTFAASAPDPNEPQATLDMTRMLHLSLRTPEHGQQDQHEGPSARAQHAISHHASVLVSTLLSSSTSLAAAILYSLTALPPQLFFALATSSSSASALTSALTSPAATPPLRRKLIARLYGQFGSTIALSPAGASVLLDGVWPGTRGIAFVRERVAEELAENESSLRASVCGRRVWKGWGMDAFGRRRREWEKWSRSEGGSEGGFAGFPERDAFPFRQQKGQHEDEGKQREHGRHAEAKTPAKKKERHMSALERARERHIRDKARKDDKQAKAAVVPAV